jgi:predicted TIM-barrel fold metal-dependent hydrolase
MNTPCSPRDEIIYLDCFALVGRHVPRDPREVWRTEDLLDEMEHCGIHGALVTHETSRIYDPAFGNRELMAEVAKSGRLWPCWVLLPSIFGEMQLADRLIEEMIAEGVPAAKLCPTRHSYHPIRDTRELCAALQEAGIPLFLEVPSADVPALAWVEELCLAWPDLPIVLLGTSWPQYRPIAAALSRCPNLHIEFSSLQANYAIELLGKIAGFERLLLGTEAQLKSPGAAKSFVDYAEIDEESRKLVAGGNLARLLKLEALPAPYPAREEEPVLAKVKRGEPLDDMLVIDAHAHWLPPGAVGAGYAMPLGDPANMARRYKRMGIDKVCTADWLAIFGDWERGNELNAATLAALPEMVVAYATLDPTEPGFEEQIDYWHLTRGFKGMKPYFPKYQIPLNDPRFDPWWHFGNEHHLFGLLHGSNNFVAEVRDLSARFPEVSWILAHSGASFGTARQYAQLANAAPNVFLEVTLTPVCHRVIELLVELAGADRVLFGTDSPMRDPIPQFGWVTYARLTHEQKRLVLGENMAQILERCRL